MQMPYMYPQTLNNLTCSDAHIFWILRNRSLCSIPLADVSNVLCFQAISLHFISVLSLVPQSWCCGGLTLAGCQVPTKLLYHSPPQQGRGRK